MQRRLCRRARREEHGVGRASFALGGSYDGEWRNGQFDSKGTVVYAGSGHRYEGRFAAGRVAGTPPRKVDTGTYILKSHDAPIGSPSRPKLATAPVPVNAPWARLTEGQRNWVKAQYYALEEGDEPPFPVNGLRELFDAVSTIKGQFPSESGVLWLYVLVGANGIAKTVTAIGSPLPELKRLVSDTVMLQRYKRARCRGKPCEMVYPFAFSFER